MSRRLLLVTAGLSLLEAAGWRGTLPGAEPADHPAAEAAGGAPAVPGAPAPPEAPAAAAAAQPAAAPRPLTAAEMQPLNELDVDRKVVAVTVDDGPDPRWTPEVLALLEKYGIRATFFLIGENAAAHPELVREIAARGHLVANHTWSHPDLRSLPEEKVREQLGRTSDFLHGVTGKAPTWFRAPGGDWSATTLKVGAELGMRPMGWSVDPQDWAEPGTDVIAQRLTKELKPGAIVLTHDGGGNRSQTVGALTRYLPAVLAAGYRFTAPRG
ncbi:polysaccharide deacetylase family protein [Kitasatospora sp. NPDC094015]|uniref:polysaccharide deacetylase family protein n=1 Tax=Kitasatospora sp. NPDC094015 TaxID=3155205 RepID=UPI00332D9581